MRIFAIMKNPVYANRIHSTSDLDKVNRIVSIFSIIKNGNLGYTHIRPRCVEVLSYYILFGYSKSTKNLIHETGITDKNLNQINSELQKKGYLIKDRGNLHNRHLAEELVTIRKYFMDEDIKKKLYVIEVL